MLIALTILATFMLVTKVIAGVFYDPDVVGILAIILLIPAAATDATWLAWTVIVWFALDGILRPIVNEEGAVFGSLISFTLCVFIYFALIA